MLTINNTLDGYLKDVEIKGNTIQDIENLADIRSVGDKVEGQELYEIPVLSRGKNLFNGILESGGYRGSTGVPYDANDRIRSKYKTKLKKGTYRVTCSDNPTTIAMTLYSDNVFVKEIAYTGTIYNFVLDADYEVNITLTTTNINTKIQIEEGTVATPYEPYQEDKLTILSPTPLEKVGDVADRIICKDGVWGVEKNINNGFIPSNASWLLQRNNGVVNRFVCLTSNMPFTDFIRATNNVITNKFIATANISDYTIGCMFGNNDGFIVHANIQDIPTLVDFKDFIGDGVYVKYPTTQPQFIPLPHDQQIKLRTFANKTNISFLTEIEGTIKAQVPKSLGSSINTHTEQINNLNKELDRVKKLEESTVSTVTTESDFTTVEATTHGYFEDVRLEGKTLVNLATQPTNNGSINHQYATISTVTNIKPSTVYTYIIRNNGRETLKLYLNHNGGFDWFDLDVEANSTVIGKAKTLPTIDGDIWLSLKKAETVEQNLQVVLLEGDHTQNPPSYFEGLKSVGQSATTSEDRVDEIVVESVNENLFDMSSKYEDAMILEDGSKIDTQDWRLHNLIKVKPNGTYYLCDDGLNFYQFIVVLYDGNKNFIGRIGRQGDDSRVYTMPSNAFYCRINYSVSVNGTPIVRNNIMLNNGTTPKPYTPHKSDKKRLLYYNEETQAWEKPILREWDSIEKHADGKYYYHQRSGEVVLNGNKTFNVSVTESDYVRCHASLNHLGMSTPIKNTSILCDRFNKESYSYLESRVCEGIGIKADGVDLGINILKSKLSTQDVQGFKQWLQANNATVVYQLAQEKVYECTNIDLITYANETNFIVESGVLSPKTTLKVHSNISNVVSLLQKKVSLLESNMTKYMITQNRLQLSSTHSADSVTFKVDYTVCSENMSQENYDTDLYNLILNNILVGKDNYDYDHMFNIIMDYASWSQISWEQFDILVGLMDIQHNPPIEEIPNEIM